MKKVGVKALAMLVALAMIFSVVPGMAGTVEAGNEGWEEEVIYLDVEVKVVNGQPMLVVEGEEEYGEEYLLIPLELPEVASFIVDGQVKELEVKNNAVLVTTEDGIVAVPIEDFCVVMVDGEVMLLAEVNPLFTIGLALLVAKFGATALGGKAAAAGVGAVGGAVVDAAIASVIVNRLNRPEPQSQ